MIRAFAIAAAVALLGLSIAAQADVFNLGAGFTNLETVAVGDARNIGELSGDVAGGYGPDRICGSVGYDYSIGKYEVTAKQYADFLNAKAKSDPYGLYNTNMTSTYGCNIQRSGSTSSYAYSVADDWANRPVNYVSFWDACRFANWLGNGQENGDTETGAYTLNGYNGQYGESIRRNTGATWAVTNEDEWYKAAYYKGGGINAGYWDYAAKSDTMPNNVGSDGYTDPGNHSNYYNYGFTIGGPYYRTNVGEFENSASAYGTFDQGGNVREWNEAIVVDMGYYRGARGGSFSNGDNCPQASDRYDRCPPAYESSILGFRVSQTVPEPSSIIALLGGLVGFLSIRRRRA